MSDTQKQQYARDFKAIVEAIAERFVYVSDKKQYGKLEYWNDLQEVAGGKLAGDCEDFCITVANRAVQAGIPLGELTLHLVSVKAPLGDHMVLSCAGELADCNAPTTKPVAGPFYFTWVSHRNLASDQWEQ